MSNLEQKIITASAAQNLDTKNERVVHRLIPMLVAEGFNRVAEYSNGSEVHRVDLWNCVGMRMDKAFLSQSNILSRNEFSTSLLDDKYLILKELGISSAKRDIVRDDDSETMLWLENKVQRLLSSGYVYIDSVAVNICDSCDYIQSIKGSEVNSCTVCKGTGFHSEEKEVLMVDLPKDKETLIRDRIIHPKNTNQIRGFFNHLPPRMMISKVREYGLPLDSIGLEGYVLDPKIGVALMPELVAEKYNLSEVNLVQGASVATNSLPYTSTLTSGFTHNYLLLPKIPMTTLEDAREIGLNFVGKYLPFILMTYNGDITPVQLKKAQEEYLRIINKTENIISLLHSKTKESISLREEDRLVLSEIIQDFSKYNIRSGQEKLAKFFKGQGRRYAEEMSTQGFYLQSTDIDTLNDIVKLFY